ncbi:MAG TPA: type II toxin-antitoxin system prevent-host-death family antitoxin [Blastocatellia bacterium]|nr:type II toxin-antitoxin system prevent-host-death family antitoxin [Blastocatellia bacterium]
MRSVNIADLKNNLSRYLNEVRAGGEVLIKDRNRPIARIVPFAAGPEDDLEKLIAEGRATPAETDEPLPESFWSRPLPRTKIDIDLVELIRQDRDAR